MKVVITGVGGFIGFRFAERALERGWEVLGIDIDEAACLRAEEIGVTTVTSDINDQSTLAAALDGQDLLIHTAAIVDEGTNRELSYRVNVEGTRSVCSAAKAAGVPRLLHLSSVMVYGFEYPEGVTEDHPLPSYDNAYNETKALSEKVARSFHDPGGLEVMILRPGDVYGPRSRSWVLRPLEVMKAGLFNLPAGGRGIINHVHVDNLIDAAFLAIDKDATGEVFNITDGEATACLDFFAYHARMLGKKSTPALPTALVKTLIAISEPFFRLQGKEPPATREALRFLLRFSKVSTEKARHELGYEPRISLQEGMKDLEATLRETGVL